MKPEEKRMLHCRSCGYAVDRDVNAGEAVVAASATVRESAKVDARQLTSQPCADKLTEPGFLLDLEIF